MDQYEQVYDKLLTETKAALPNVKFILCEPFTLPVGKRKEGYPGWYDGIKKRQAIVAKLAEKHHAALVHFQKAFDEACLKASADHWIWDGVHPTYSGHQVMADEWVKIIKACLAN
jgi:lysophospholipase L1-like esterase